MLHRSVVPFPAYGWVRGFIRLLPACLLLATAAARAAAPDLAEIGNQQVREGATLNVDVIAIDPDDGDRVDLSASGLPVFCSLTPIGDGVAVINCSPGLGDANTYTVTVTATDDSQFPEQTSETFDIVVTANSAPTLTSIGPQSVAEGASINIQLTATDDDGDALTFSFRSAPSTAQSFCSLTDNGNGTGTLVCRPGAGSAGNYNVTVTVRDNAPFTLSDSDSFALSVSSNRAPTLGNIGNQSVVEGSSIGIPLSASDPDGDGLSFSFSSTPSTAQGFCSLTDNGNGTGILACSPGAGRGGNYTITVTVRDDAPIPLSDSDSFTLSVSSNRAPVLGTIGNQSVAEGGSISIPLNASDPDGNSLRFSQSGLPGFCSLVDNGNGTGGIDCRPKVGDNGNYSVTIAVTDNAPIPLSDSETFTLSVSANQAPTATNVTITGDPSVDSVLTGNYTYNDAEQDPEGVSTFRWLRNGVPISGATAKRYTVVDADVGNSLRFEVTPVARSGVTQGAPVRSAAFEILNSPPVISGQTPNPIEIQEDTSREITLDDLVASDPEGQELTVRVRNGANYLRSGNTITPVADFDGTLSVPVTVFDGTDESNVFNLVVDVLPVNDAPRFGGVVPPGLTTPEDTTLTITVDDLVINDPDSNTFTLTLNPPLPDANYTLAGPASVTPAENFNGRLFVRAAVSDGEASSAPFTIPVDVEAVNDRPIVVEPIGAQNAVEDSPFTLDVSANFADADGDPLTYTADIEPPIPPERGITFDGATGRFSGTPAFNENDPEDPVYAVTITALDGSEDGLVADTFDLTISQLGRANLGLEITVSPETATPNEQLRWTFATNNPIGPAPGQNVELTGSFIGSGLTVGVEGGANCTVNTQAGKVNFTCAVGALPIGETVAVELSTAASQSTEVVAFATTAGAQPIPIDPNLANNSAVRAVGVAESFSQGAVQILGDAAILSMAAGDVNGDGAPDIVAGTESGRPVQIFLGAAPRESCGCQRDFETAPLTVPDTGANRGVALADFDNNGTLDLVIANGADQPDAVYLNDGAGNFSPAVILEPSNGRDVAVGDFNNDGNLDIAVAAGSPNPVYFGDGSGGFSAPILLGDQNSSGVAVGRFNGDNLDDLVFANIGAESRIWTATAGGGFAEVILPTATVGDAASVAAADLNNDGLDDLVFGRVSAGMDDIPSNPVLLNQGAATFGAPAAELGLSPTRDVLIGDVSEDGQLDIVFINDSGLHQRWTGSGSEFTLHSEQIIDIGAVAGVLADLGFADSGDPGGIDLALGGAPEAGVGVYLNDSAGNLGLGDAVPPVITLNGEASVTIPANSVYNDAGATADDNIDGTFTAVATSNVNPAVVGSYTVTYNATDRAGNAATPVVRTVTVGAATGRGGGGGGAVGYWTLALLVGIHLVVLARARNLCSGVPDQGG
jgi:hypothetical protein